MLRLCFLPLAILYSLAAQAQYVYAIKADSVKLTNNCDSTELILMNHTQGIPGFLFNYSNGRTRFQRGLVSLGNNTYLIGADTLKPGCCGPMQVPDIPTMIADTAQCNNILVTDSLRGGLFVYQSTAALPDSGIVFLATGRGSGYWVRTGAINTPANIEWYGAIPNISGDATINYHAIQSCINHNTWVYLPAGNFYIDSTLYVNNGIRLTGTKAAANGTTGSLLSVTDTLTGLIINVNGQNNNFSVLENFVIETSATGGTLNDGIVATKGFFSATNVAVYRFGREGFNITSNYPTGTTVMDYGVLTNCTASGCKDGFYIGNGPDNNVLTLMNCITLDNTRWGIYNNGKHNTFINCSGTYDGQYDFYEDGANSYWVNPYAEGGTGEVFAVSATSEGGVLESANSFGAIFPTFLGGIQNMTVRLGNYYGTAMTLGDNMYDQDSVLWTIQNGGAFYQVGVLRYTMQKRGYSSSPVEVMDLDSSGLIMNSPAGIFSSFVNLLGSGSGVTLSAIQGSIPFLQITAYGEGGGAQYLGMHGDPFVSGTRYLLFGQNYSFDNDFLVNAYSSHSNAGSGVLAGYMTSTSEDSTGVTRANNFGFKFYTDATGANYLTSYGGAEDYTQGGNFTVLNNDLSTNEYINVFNHSTYVSKLKLGASATATSGDSVVVWEASDSSARKMQPTDLVIGTTQVITITGNYTAPTSYARSMIVLNATSGTITLPDPTATSSQSKFYFIRVKSSGQTATVATAAGSIETSFGSYGSTATITGIPAQGWISDGTNWILATN